MVQRTSALLQRLTESATLAMARKAAELKAAGIDVISLSLGEPDFDTPEPIKAAGIRGIEENFSHYTPVPGLLSLREAIARKLKRDNGLDYKPSQIVVSNGAKQSITNAVLALIDPGDEVLIPAPYWVSYVDMVQLAGGTPVIVTTTVDQDFKPTPEAVEAAITPRTRLLIYSSPCNPSGSVFSADEIAGIAGVLERNPHVLAISDEIYELIQFEGRSPSLASHASIADRVMTVNGVSKGFAMTGWRLGYIAAPQWIADACSKIQGQVTSAPCSIAQVAAEAAVSADPSIADGMREAFLRRRNLVLEKVADIPGWKSHRPNGAFYLFPDVSGWLGKSYQGQVLKDGDDVALFLLSAAQVAVVGGPAFGTPECIRISYAASDEVLLEAMNRIIAAAKLLE